jgi:hypothetical protein
MATWPTSVLQQQYGQELEALIEEGLVYGEQNDAVEAIVRASCRSIAGLPTAVQCVSLPWKEEVCLRVMREVHADAKALGRLARVDLA